MNDYSIPLVSVVMTAYNIEKYLSQAIESVLSQKVSFKFEIVIGEDCSTDKTKDIALSYQKANPEIIKVLVPVKNQGITLNCIATHNACRGKYIAMLDGDDYWTSDDKLQNQIDFLENNPSYSGSAHQAMVVYSEHSKAHNFGPEQEQDFGILDTISHRKFHTSSLVYRKEIWDKVGGIPATVSVSNDRAIYPMVAIFGKIKYFKESMCVYRKTGLGISSMVSYKQLITELNMIPWLKNIDETFPVIRFKSFLHLSIYSSCRKITFSHIIKHFVLFFINSFSYFPNNLKDVKYGIIFLLRRIFHE